MQRLVKSNKMAITEFVFPRLNRDPSLLQELRKVLPPAAKVTFSDVPGLLSYYRGKVVKAENIAGNADVEHSGLVLALEWDHVSSFNAFWISEKFASFRDVMKPYLLGPVAPDLFTSDNQSQSGGTTTSKYTQYIKVSGIKGPDTQVEGAWNALIVELDSQKTPSFSAWGVQDTDAFAGMLGWSSLEESETAIALPSVKACLEKLSAYGPVSSYVLELEKQE
ncbi:hypothetical protein AK830_g1315 [Neonectria ditissima]|uniref:EthD domain-containing protein n=1 Tax=Neonectria ditissima TaxID=78410 RepID=A0A0P7BUT2_9HYPO|nr:hypothetical protein AK830_g1315 [Neonectria ditissima]